MAGSDNESDDASVHSEATIAQQQQNIQPQIITTVSNNNAKFPYLKKDEYEVWAMKMEYWITNNDMNIWKVIQNGNSLKRTGRDRDGRVIILPPTTANEHIVVQKESKARTTLLQSIPDDHVADFHYMDDARDIWNAVKARFGGNAESKKMRKAMLKQEFSEFRISESEGLHKGYDRMQKRKVVVVAKLYKDVVANLVKKVKAMEVKLKTKKRKVVVSDSDQEEGGEQAMDLDALIALANAAVTVDSNISPGGASNNPAASSYIPTDVPIGGDFAPAHSTSPSRDPFKRKGIAKPSSPVSERTKKQLANEKLSEIEAARLEALERERSEKEKAKISRYD
ncbi:hypothetical protein Tco_1463455, partial [Tanacetum coccineum]